MAYQRLTIGRKYIKGGLDNKGPVVSEDFVEIGEVDSAVAKSALARLQFIYDQLIRDKKRI